MGDCWAIYFIHLLVDFNAKKLFLALFHKAVLVFFYIYPFATNLRFFAK